MTFDLTFDHAPSKCEREFGLQPLLSSSSHDLFLFLFVLVCVVDYCEVNVSLCSIRGAVNEI